MPLEKQWKFEDSSIWKLKLKLQFSGWLQYIIHAVWILALLVIAVVGWLISLLVGGKLILFWLPFVLALLLTIALVGTILIVKYGLHPSEKIPASKYNLEVFDIISSRRSCRSFQSRDLTEEHREKLLKVVKSYSQLNQLLGDKQIRFEYIKAPLTVWPVVGAHEFLVAIAPREYNRLSVIDIGRSLQKVVIEATRMGLATCWIGPGADNKSILQHLGNKIDSEKDHVICVCAIGYSSMYKPLFIRLFNKITHKRLPLSELFFSDSLLAIPLATDSNPYSDYKRCYEACRWAPSSYNAQTTRCVAELEKIGDEEKLKKFSFYSSISSRYYAPVALGIWCANWEISCDALGKEGYFEPLSNQQEHGDNLKPPVCDISWVVE